MRSLGPIVFADIARKIIEPNSELNLSDPLVIRTIIEGVLFASGIVLQPTVVEAAATIIAEGNQRIDALPRGANVAYLESVGRIQTAAQGVVAHDLQELASGRSDAATILAANTGTAMEARIAETAIGPALVPRVQISDALIGERE